MKTNDILLGITTIAVGVIVWKHFNPEDGSIKEAVKNIIPKPITETTIFEKLDQKIMTPQRSLIPGTEKILTVAVPDSPGLKPSTVYKPTPVVASPSGTLPKEVFMHQLELVPTTLTKPWLTNQ